MNVDFENIKSYLENKEENIYVKMFNFSVIISVLLILVVVYSSYKKKEIYYENVLYVKNSEIILSVDYNELEHIIDNNKMIINNNYHNYIIDEINILDNSIKYEVKIIINSQELFYNNVFYKYKILLMEESVLNYIVRVIKGG